MKWGASLVFGVWMLFSHSTGETAMQEPQHLVVDIIAINGDEFTVKDESGKEAKIHVGTAEKFGQLQPGDRVEAWVYPNGQAKTVMIIRSASVIKEDREQQQQREAQQRAEAPEATQAAEAAR